ncbi:MAG: AMP-binding protein [Thermoleophilia bacterium]
MRAPASAQAVLDHSLDRFASAGTTGVAPSLSAALIRFADRPALVGDGVRLTYRELSAAVAHRRSELGEAPALVAITGAYDVEWVATCLAAITGPHVAWPIMSAEQLAGAPFEPDVVARGSDIDRFGTVARPLHSELGALLATSGSTGSPQHVRLSRTNLDVNALQIAAALGLTDTDRAITSLPLGYCFGLSVLTSHLIVGATVVLSDASVMQDAFWSTVARERVTTIAGVPHTFDLLDSIGFDGAGFPHLRRLIQAGGRLSPERVRRLGEMGREHGWEFRAMYGQTEATARMTIAEPGDALDHPATAGRPVPGGTVTIEHDPELDPPHHGEIVYRGPNVMLGYAEHEADLARGRTVDRIHTGDVGRVVDGRLQVTGRRARFIKPAGVRVDLDAVEQMLEQEGLAAHCTGSDRCLMVALTGGEACPEDLSRRLCTRLRLTPSMVSVQSCLDVPRRPNGKPDHVALHDMLATPEAARPSEDDVAAIYRSALGRPDVPGDRTFIELGGDSLSYIDAQLGLEDLLPELPDDWPERTVDDLEALRSNGDARSAAGTDTAMVLRAAAICMVVAGHMTALVPAGGAHLLFGLSGHAFSRFALGGASGIRTWASRIGRIALPTMIWIAALMMLEGTHSPGSLLLVNNYIGESAFTERRWEYWYVEALIQTLLLLALVCSLPAVRRLNARHPFALATVAMLTAVAVREAVSPGAANTMFFRPHVVLWVFALGWMVHRAGSDRQRLLVSASILVTTPGALGQPSREITVAAGLLLLTWAPRIPLPRPLGRGFAVIAAGSLAIYLTHWQVWPRWEAVVPTPIAVMMTIATGVIAGRATGVAWSALRRAERARRLRQELAHAGQAFVERLRPGGDRVGHTNQRP